MVTRNIDEITPFHMAARCRFLEILILLYARDPNLVHHTDSNGESALFYAIRGRHLSCISFLMEKNPSMTITNTAGISAAQLAASEMIYLQSAWWADEIKTLTRDTMIACPIINICRVPKHEVPSDVLEEALKQKFGGLKMFALQESHNSSGHYNVFASFFHPEAYHNAIKSKYLKVGPTQLRIRQAYKKQGPNVFQDVRMCS